MRVIPIACAEYRHSFSLVVSHFVQHNKQTLSQGCCSGALLHGQSTKSEHKLHVMLSWHGCVYWYMGEVKEYGHYWCKSGLLHCVSFWFSNNTSTSFGGPRNAGRPDDMWQDLWKGGLLLKIPKLSYWHHLKASTAEITMNFEPTQYLILFQSYCTFYYSFSIHFECKLMTLQAFYRFLLQSW